jgi:hypothetical protein
MFFKLISPSIKFSFSLPLPLPLRSRHTGELCFNFSQNVRCVRELLRGFYLAGPQTVLNLNLFYRRMSVESSPKKKKSSLKSTVVFGSRRQSFLDHWIILWRIHSARSLSCLSLPLPLPPGRRSRSRSPRHTKHVHEKHNKSKDRSKGASSRSSSPGSDHLCRRHRSPSRSRSRSPHDRPAAPQSYSLEHF